jgi:twinkle protein
MAEPQDRGAAFLDERAASRPQVLTPGALWSDLERLWSTGLESGTRTGWPCLDELYTVAPGQWTLVTGYPSSGKSEWVDALTVNLSHAGWRFVVFSPENQPLELHIAKLTEKLSGKPFGAGPTERLSLEEVGRQVDALSERYRFLRCPHDASMTIPDILDTVTPVLADLGGEHQGLVIDPWNELEHWRPPGLSETEYVSKALSLLRNWAREHRVHVWLVAHPQKLRRENGKLPIPTPDSVSGSAHFWNKADVAITVHREGGDEVPNVSIVVQKCRFKHIGRRGVVTLRYNRVTGTYRDPLARPVSVQREAF